MRLYAFVCRLNVSQMVLWGLSLADEMNFEKYSSSVNCFKKSNDNPAGCEVWEEHKSNIVSLV